jgi:hypothetical protein
VGNQAWVNGPLGNMSMFLGPVIYPNDPACILELCDGVDHRLVCLMGR